MTSELWAGRQAALRERMGKAGADALLVVHGPNIRYLTGFTGSAGLLLMSKDGATLITDFRYAEQAPHEVGQAAEVVIDPVNIWDRLKRVLSGRGGPGAAALGFESHVLTVRDARRLEGLGWTPVPVADMVEGLRASKAPVEVAAIRAAACLAQDALADVVPTIRVGDSELAVGARLEAALRGRGSEWHPFPTIVASGPRSALPHARTTARILVPGDWLLIDFGAIVDGYCADLTRTFVVGARADPRQRAAHEVVQGAQRRAMANVRAGMTGREADALARDVIAASGFGEQFGHSLGHGLGLEVHEAPRLSPTAEAALPAGAVVTIEPGLYFPGWGGVRLEDDVWVGPEGAECLSDGATELVELDV